MAKSCITTFPRRTVASFAGLLLATLLTGLAMSSRSAVSAELRILNSYDTLGDSSGAAVQTSDGLIWTGAVNGRLRRFDPASPGRIVSETKLEFGIERCLMTTWDKKNKEIVLVGHGNGHNCYATDGTELFREEDLGATFSEAGINWDDQIVLVSRDGVSHRFNNSDLRLEEFDHRDGALPGSLTCAPTLMLRPEPVLIFGTKALGDVLTRAYAYYITLTPLSGQHAGHPTTFPLKSIGKVVFRPTIVRIGSHDRAFIVTTKGEVITADRGKVNAVPIIHLNSAEVWTPVIDLNDQRLCVFAYDGTLTPYVRWLFSSDGALISKSTVQDVGRSALSAKASSPPLIFRDKGERVLILQGFNDRYLRLIDVATGKVKASLKTNDIITVSPVLLDRSHVFVTETHSHFDNQISEFTKQTLIEVCP